MQKISKIQKIDQQQNYPCPCRKRAKLKPIVLTDAFGCDRCPLMFAIEDGGYSLVQLGGIDPYRRVWHWIGTKWQANRELSPKYPLEFIPTQLLLASIVILMLMLFLALSIESLGLPLALIAVAPLIVVVWWLMLRRHES